MRPETVINDFCKAKSMSPAHNIFSHTARVSLAAATLLSLMTYSTSSTVAASCPAAGTVQSAENALRVAAQRGSASAFATALDRYANVNGIAISALGQYRASLPAARRSEYIANTRRYVSRYLANNAGRLRSASDLTIQSCDSGLVQTSLGSGSTILWRMAGTRIEDVQVEGIWLGLQLRSKFVDIIRRNQGDVDALLDFLSRQEKAGD